MKTLEIYFDDLTKNMQKQVLSLYGIESQNDLALGPIFVLEYEDKNE